MRPIGMRSSSTALLLTLLTALAGCGDSSTTSSPPDVDACPGQGSVLVKADLDADGAPEPLRLTGAGSGPCAHRLLGPGGVSADVAGLNLVPSKARIVHLEGQDAGDLVLVPARPHPRGGYQVHLFGRGGDTGLVEVKAHGHPVVPFVSTDGGAAPMTATCTPGGGIGILTAKAHEPPGVILAWDLTLTSYDIEDGRAISRGRRLVAEAAADPTLRKERPELFDGSLFADCS